MRLLSIIKSKKPKVFSRLAVVISAILITVTGTASAATPCEAIIQDAYKRLDELCSTVARNEACYGNDSIRTELNLPYESHIFSKGGDKAPLTAIRELYTLPLDTATNTWGLSLMKVQANLPDTAPGQNIIFVLYGDVHLSNADTQGKMAAFYFTSGLGQPACKAAPVDGMIVRSPKGTRVQFSANGVNIDIGSTVVLQAIPNKELTVQLVEGSAKITAGNQTRSPTPGQSLTVPLGGSDGLHAIGAPSAPINNPVSAAHQKFLNALPHALPIPALPGNTNPPGTNGQGNGSGKDDKDKKDKKDDDHHNHGGHGGHGHGR